ncbi:hypothetical protein [Dehalobacter restrictus]|uniref:hypothetical protein n=1 Tax=Dehalobacter restrictus TaxID=55583 RepID=UPI0033907312
MKNKLTDLNNHLFAQLERLGDESLTDEDLNKEIGRAKAITNIAQQIVNNGNLALNVIKTKEEYFPNAKALPEMFSDVETVELPNDKKVPGRLKDGYE